MAFQLIGATGLEHLTHRKNYGGRYNVFHLHGNRHRRGQFALRLPRELTLADLKAATLPLVGQWRKTTGKMDGHQFDKVELVVTPRPEGIKTPLPKGRLHIARQPNDAAQTPWLRDNLLTVASHTQSGGWFTYRVWIEKEITP